MENWSKTILYSYRYLKTLTESIDEMVRRMSIGSMRYNSKSTSDTQSQIENLIHLNDRKVGLINLKVIVEQSLEKLGGKDLEFISLYYIDGLSYEEMVDALGTSLRTVFRRKKSAIESFSQILEEDYGLQYFMKNYKEEKWLIDLYNFNVRKSSVVKINNKDYDRDTYSNGKEIFGAIKELRKMAI